MCEQLQKCMQGLNEEGNTFGNSEKECNKPWCRVVKNLHLIIKLKNVKQNNRVTKNGIARKID